MTEVGWFAFLLRFGLQQVPVVRFPLCPAFLEKSIVVMERGHVIVSSFSSALFSPQEGIVRLTRSVEVWSEGPAEKETATTKIAEYPGWPSCDSLTTYI